MMTDASDEDIQTQIDAAVREMGKKLPARNSEIRQNPLLVSVRSGARASMPGMMDTILNLGLNEEVVEIIAKKTGNERWARDCYRRFIQMYSDVVMEVGKKYFEELIDQMKNARGVTQDVRSDRCRSQGACYTVQGRIQSKDRCRLPGRPERAADGCYQSGVPLLG